MTADLVASGGTGRSRRVRGVVPDGAPSSGGRRTRVGSAVVRALTGYVPRRLGQALLVLFLAFTAAFVLLQAMPGDAIMIRFENPELGLSPEQIADIRLAYGVDQPVLVQYLHTLSGFVQGDFGYSIVSGTPVRQLIAEVLPHTLVLAAVGFTLAVALAFVIAFASSYARFAWIRTALRSVPSLFVSVPVFWLGILLIQVFSFRLGLVAVINPGPVEGLILPVLTLAVPISAPISQILTRSIDEVYTQPFVAVVQAKGASRSWVLWRNVLKNATLPTLTMAGILFGELIGGAVVTETVYGRAGIGRITEQAVTNQDVPVLQAIVLLAAVVFVVVNLAVDLVYPRLDPRLRRR